MDVDENILVLFRWLVSISKNKCGLLGLGRSMHCTSGHFFTDIFLLQLSFLKKSCICL